MPTSNDPRRERSTDHDPTTATAPRAAGTGDDLDGFATFRRSAGNLPVVAVLVVAALFSLAVLSWVYFLR